MQQPSTTQLNMCSIVPLKAIATCENYCEKSMKTIVHMFHMQINKIKYLKSASIFRQIAMTSHYKFDTLNCCIEVKEGKTDWVRLRCRAARRSVESEILRDIFRFSASWSAECAEIGTAGTGGRDGCWGVEGGAVQGLLYEGWSLGWMWSSKLPGPLFLLTASDLGGVRQWCRRGTDLV